MRHLAIITAAATLGAAVPAAAQTVTFDGQATSGFINQYGPEYQEGDLSFASQTGAPYSLFSFGPSFSADPDGATIATTTGNDVLLITRIGGGTFGLTSLDLADAFNSGHTGTVNYSLVTSSGTVNGAFTLDAIKGLQTFTLNWTGVVSLGLSGSPYQLDNVAYSLGSAAPTVPEPASWAMLLAGTALLGGALRRRRATPVPATLR